MAYLTESSKKYVKYLNNKPSFKEQIEQIVNQLGYNMHKSTKTPLNSPKTLSNAPKQEKGTI